MRAAGCCSSKMESQVWYSSGLDQPRRVLMETGRLVDLRAFW